MSDGAVSQISSILQMMRPQAPGNGTPPGPLSTGDFYMPTQKLPLRFGGRQIVPNDPMYQLIEHLILQRYRLPQGVSNRG